MTYKGNNFGLVSIIKTFKKDISNNIGDNTLCVMKNSGILNDITFIFSFKSHVKKCTNITE